MFPSNICLYGCDAGLRTTCFFFGGALRKLFRARGCFCAVGFGFRGNIGLLYAGCDLFCISSSFRGNIGFYAAGCNVFCDSFRTKGCDVFCALGFGFSGVFFCDSFRTRGFDVFCDSFRRTRGCDVFPARGWASAKRSGGSPTRAPHALAVHPTH